MVRTVGVRGEGRAPGEQVRRHCAGITEDPWSTLVLQRDPDHSCGPELFRYGMGVGGAESIAEA